MTTPSSVTSGGSVGGASAAVIDRLRSEAAADAGFLNLLLASLEQAGSRAASDLDPALYAALRWPLDLDTYIAFLDGFARWIPQQSTDAAWTAPGTDEQQEVYDRLCHFHWLINQPVGPDGTTIVQSIDWFGQWLVDYANAWGSFLDTPDSFDEAVLAQFRDDSPEYTVDDSMVNGRPNNPSGWLTFNQFFARELNPGLRPISSPADNSTVTSPADCTFKATYRIAADSTIPAVTLKKTHSVASVEELLQGSPHADAFAGGTFVHYFLGPYSYHRFHTPVAGKLLECRAVRGLVYLDVNLAKGQFDAPDASEGGYEFAQARGVVVMDTVDSPFGDVGLIAVVPVGMCQVSSVNMTATVGRQMLKGDEFGYFLFGGSDIIVLFQTGAEPEIDRGTRYRHYGTPIATCHAQ